MNLKGLVEEVRKLKENNNPIDNIQLEIIKQTVEAFEPYINGTVITEEQYKDRETLNKLLGIE